MKKIILVALTLFTFTGISLAQFEQGRILAGGSIGFSTNTNKSKVNNTTTTNSKSASFNFNPKAGYFIINNLAVGAGLDLGVSSYKQEGATHKSTGSSIAIDPFVRYYLKQGIFFQGQFGVGSSKSKYYYGNTPYTDKYNTTNWSLAAGYALFLNNNVAIEPMVGYRSDTDKPKGSDNKTINGGLFVNVGFQIYLGKK